MSGCRGTGRANVPTRQKVKVSFNGPGIFRVRIWAQLAADMPRYRQVKRNRDLSLHADPYSFFCFFPFFFLGLLCLFLFLPMRSRLRFTLCNAGCLECFGGQQDPSVPPLMSVRLCRAGHRAPGLITYMCAACLGRLAEEKHHRDHSRHSPSMPNVGLHTGFRRTAGLAFPR